MADVRRIVLDVLIPHDPSLLEFTDRIAEVDGVGGATATVVELDEDVQNLTVAVEGQRLEYEAIEATIEDLGGTIHSVDQVACGERVVERRPTPQDG
ncbi:hypothetical protein L593_13175 [Salinarchaeum sp. Harcht-Bsk1]|uniref:DUF211 domain-containing protein n=1 Tax=Salinarchaeum sp. Harcht-Bsk1 TaxID=1333523 RepID=UPI0003423D26|nr:DUF211 domain-containing protein [Salinarchaeum sp. Harcht-Bsk1]AGN02574.1 hypothetical protein L593_13175 [Salinarchaeum sp. Harcht-Bsk1]